MLASLSVPTVLHAFSAVRLVVFYQTCLLAYCFNVPTHLYKVTKGKKKQQHLFVTQTLFVTHLSGVGKAYDRSKHRLSVAA